MGFKCRWSGHQYEDGKCSVCGQPFDYEKELKTVESIDSLITLAVRLDKLPQDAVIYLARNSHKYSVSDLAIKKIKDKQLQVDAALARNDHNLSYGVLLLQRDQALIEKFLDDENAMVRNLAKEMYKISKMPLEELKDYRSYEGAADNFISYRLKEEVE